MAGEGDLPLSTDIHCTSAGHKSSPSSINCKLSTNWQKYLSNITLVTVRKEEKTHEMLSAELTENTSVNEILLRAVILKCEVRE